MHFNKVVTVFLCLLFLLGLSSFGNRIVEAIHVRLTDPTAIARSVWLYDYHNSAAVDVSCVSDNLSGLSYNAISQRWFAIVNRPAKLVEIDLNGNCLAIYPLPTLIDTEAVAWIGETQLLVVEERESRISKLTLPSGKQPLSLEPLIALNALADGSDNLGIEGMTYMAEHDKVFVAKEKRPRKVIEIQGLLDRQRYAEVTVKERDDISLWLLGARDFSGLHYDANSGNLLILSDDSKRVIEMSLTGQFISTLPLTGGQSGLATAIGQPEGIALGEGELVILGEPNRLYRFQRQPASR